MIEYCRLHFPADRFTFRLSPQRSSVYGSHNEMREDPSILFIGDPNSKDFIFSSSLFTHLLEEKIDFYLRESYKALRPNGRILMSFFCVEYVKKGGRWNFSHQVGRAYVENAKYPEAAVAYTAQDMVELARECGFSEVSIRPSSFQSALLAQK
jgi:predicted SAM-dependent methyltransferase